MDLDREPMFYPPGLHAGRYYSLKRDYLDGFVATLRELDVLPPYAWTRHSHGLRRGTADAVCIKGGTDQTIPEDVLFPVIIRRSLDVQSSDLIKDYNRDIQQGTNRPATIALRHLFACMCLNGYRYGMLSTVAQTWFVLRMTQGSKDICVSPAIAHGRKRPSLFQCYLWFIRQASTDTWQLDPPTEQVVSQWIEEESPGVLPEKGTSKRTPPKANAKNTRASTTMVLPAFNDTFQLLWSTDNSVAYRLNMRTLGDVVVKKADIVNQAVAVELMRQEIRIYHHMQSLQGTHIPKLHFTGIADGIEFVLVMEYVGKTIEKMKLSLEDCETIIAHMEALHDAGVVHGDIRPENITQLQKDDGSHEYRFIDFGHSKFTTVKRRHDHEMDQLENMLMDMLDPLTA
ncbi:hypothetical protein BG003_005626 [Podila horticola]|nr:hypothetical protein BG003_005626 [Podila horticola]